jgi:uncharacterized protein involved in exopolysaccharide biosynthesis
MENAMNNRSILETAAGWWRRRKWLFLVIFLLIFTLAASLVGALPPLYRASTTLLAGENEMTESLVTPDARDDLELRLAAIREAVLSRRQLQQVIDSFDLYPELRDRASPQTVLRRFRRDLDVEQTASTEPQWGKSSTYIITIGYQYWDPQRVAQVANELAARFEAENRKILRTQAAQTTEFLRGQVEAARRALERQEYRMNSFRNLHLGELPEQQAYNLATLERLTGELRLNREKQAALLKPPEGMPSASAGTGSPLSAPGLTGKLRLEWLQRELEALQNRYTDAHPQVIRLKREIDQLSRRLPPQRSGDMPVTLGDLRRTEAELRDEIAEVTRRIETTPQVDQQLSRIAYEYNAAKETYLSLNRLYQDAHLAESLEQRKNQQFKVVDAAISPDSPSAPNRTRLLFMSLVLAAGIAAFAVLLAERLDDRFHSLADIRRFTRVPVLANVGRISTARDSWRRSRRIVALSVLVVTALLLAAGISSYIGSNARELVLAISS